MLFYVSFPILESETEEEQGGHYVFGFSMFAFLIVKSQTLFCFSPKTRVENLDYKFMISYSLIQYLIQSRFEFK